MNKLYLLCTRGGLNKLSAALPFILLFVLFAVASQPVRAQLSLTNVAPSATIDFSNTMQTTVGSNPSTAFTAAGFEPFSGSTPAAGRLNSNAWATTGWSDQPDLGFGGTKIAAGTDYTRGSTAVAVTQGGIYAYTGAPVSVANPTLMMQPGGSDFTAGTLTLKIQNNGTTLINQLAVAYNIYVRNDQLRSQSFNFSYSSDNVTYTSVAAMDYATPTTADALGWVVVAGGPSRSTNITGINIAPGGGVFYIRWTSDDVSGSGSRDEIGLDDISLTGNFVTACSPPSTAAFLLDIPVILRKQMDITFQRGNGTGGLLIVASEGTTLTPAGVIGNPVSGVTYHANSNYGTGDPIGNGFVVYNSGSIPALGVGTFTMTGLKTNTFYSLKYFEYDVSVPCYDASPNTDDQQTNLISTTANPTTNTDKFRSLITGNWANANTWQHSWDGGTSWEGSDLPPDITSSSIAIMGPHTVDITCPVSMDQTSLAGILTLSNDGKITLNNDAGYDIDILSGGTLRTQTSTNYALTFAYTGGPQINVSTGGKITLGNNSSAPGYSALGYTSGLVNWNDGSILEWNSPDPFITAGSITYFPDAAAGTIPVFRVSRSPSLQPGAGTPTGWNGLLEVNANLTLKLGGIKTFRNGIIGSATLFQDDNCAQFVINGATAQLGGTGAIHLNSAGMEINSPSVTTMTSNKTINLTAGVGTLTVNGSLYCAANILSGTSIFTLSPGGTLGLGSGGGISSAGATGNIQVGGARTFAAGGNYIYNGSVNQVTGNGLPSSVTGFITIGNTGGAGSNTVTLTTNNTTVTTFNLASGLFEAGTSQQLNILTGGTVNGSGGNQSQSAAAGIISMGTSAAGTETINPGTALSLTNVDLNNGVNMGSGNTSIIGTLNIKANGYVTTGTAPTYSSTPGSTLLYSCGCNYGAGEEWYENNFGTSPGVPHNVTLAAGTSMNFTSAGFPREMRGNLTINNNSTFALSTFFGGDLFIKGNWIRTGAASVFTPNDRAVKFNGSNNTTISATNGETFAYVILQKDASSQSLSLSNNIRISKELKITTGTFDLVNSNATLLSNATATASFAAMAITENIVYSGTGRFVVDRYIPTGVSHAKSWQFLATPVNGGQTVNAAWQEGATVANQNLVPGYGTQLTSNVAGATTFPSPGFDVLTPIGPSVKTYDPATNAWVGIANTTIPIYNQKGYMIFVRGDRSVSFGQPAVATILRTTGKLFDPGPNIPPINTIGANQFESIGNPYASAIDFSNDAAVAKSANVQKVFYLWDPKLGGAYGLGAFQTFTKGAGTDYTVSPGGGSYGASGSVNNIIQSGQAFFVHTVGGTGTVVFTEAAKVSGSSITFKPVNIVSDKQIRNNLYVITGGEPVLIDGVLNQLDAGYSNKTDELDALKFSNSGENIGISRDNKILAVERMAMIESTDTIFYNLGQMKPNQYQFEFTPDNLSIAGLEAFLEDSYLGTSTAISLSDTTRFNFNVNNEAGSYTAGRFRLVFTQKNTPVKYTDIHAEQQDNDIAVSWKVSDQAGVDHYELERSPDGINFTVIHTEAVAGNNIASYNWIDLDPFSGANFYRVRSISIVGGTVYSKQVKVFIEKGAGNFVIYPNPVKEGIIGLQLYQLPAAVYLVKLYNSGGQVILSRNLYHTGGNGIQQIQAGAALAKGVYKLEITSPEGLRQTNKLLVE